MDFAVEMVTSPFVEVKQKGPLVRLTEVRMHQEQLAQVDKRH